MKLGKEINLQEFKLSDDFVAAYQEREQNGDNPLLESFNGLGFVVYKRTYARPIYSPEGNVVRTEDWFETVRRVVEGAVSIGSGLTEPEAERLFDHIWNLRGFPGGRMLWQLGTENNARLGGDSLVNCWFVRLETAEDLGWMFERLMLGGGVGFSITNPSRFGQLNSAVVSHLPEAKDADFIVPDKREGWAELLQRTISAYQKGEDFTYSTVLIRPEGAPIKTFGGVASGPGILVEGIQNICDILDKAVGRELTSVELLDIANVVGSIVVSGNVRRSAQIALGSAYDKDYLAAKRWDLGGIPSYRAMSNNSVYVASMEDLPAEFWEGYKGNGEPYGIVNIAAAQDYGRVGERKADLSIEGFNPCAEIGLAHRESCNLSEIALPNVDSEEQLRDIAKLLYKVQKAVAALPYLDPESDAITSKNMRLGLGVTGIAQAGFDRIGWLDETYRELERFDAVWSDQMGYPESVRLTTVKPSGTLSLLAGVTPGAHPGFSQYHIRRVRMATNDPVFKWCQDQGLNWEFVRDFEGNQDARTGIVEFPCEFPQGTLLAEYTSAISQMEMVKLMQQVWADNAVSVTVYYDMDELIEVMDWLKNNWGEFKSMSFLLRQNHGFEQAPLEEITKEQYDQLLAGIDYSHFHIHGGPADLEDADCVSGACPVR